MKETLSGGVSSKTGEKINQNYTDSFNVAEAYYSMC